MPRRVWSDINLNFVSPPVRVSSNSGGDLIPALIFEGENMNNHRTCRHWLAVQSITLSAGRINITIATENLVDGLWYSLRIPLGTFPAGVTGTETVWIINGTTSIQIGDWRARHLLSERVLRGGERFRMVYTENGVGTPVPPATSNPLFLVREGIVQIP